MEEYIIGGLIGAVFGYIVSHTLDFIKNRYTNYCLSKNRSKEIGNLTQLQFLNQSGYMAFDHAIPMYKYENITLKKTNAEFFISLPDSYKKELRKYNFEIHSKKLSLPVDLKVIFASLQIDDYESVINETSIEVAKEFIEELQEGKIRFNGKLFGIENIRINRISVEEYASLSIDFYVTDYFTFRTFASIYKKYRDRFTIQNIQDIKRYTPFLSSFGLGCFVIANDGHQDMVLLAYRSDNVIVDKNMIHFSMNEAFSLLDIDEYGHPSLTSCLFRGLKEELGIGEKYKYTVTEYGFLDLGIDINRFEAGISSFVRIKFDSVFTPSVLENLYSIAQDRELETTKLEFVPIKHIDRYIDQHKNNMSAGCKATLQALYVRYKNGYIKEEV